MNQAPDFKIKLTDEQNARLKILAKREGVNPSEWLRREATRAAKQILNEVDEVDPKEAGRMLGGLSRITIIRYFNQGMFPGAYLFNQRVIRIPKADVEAFKRSRRVSLMA